MRFLALASLLALLSLLGLAAPAEISGNAEVRRAYLGEAETP